MVKSCPLVLILGFAFLACTDYGGDATEDPATEAGATSAAVIGAPEPVWFQKLPAANKNALRAWARQVVLDFCSAFLKANGAPGLATCGDIANLNTIQNAANQLVYDIGDANLLTRLPNDYFKPEAQEQQWMVPTRARINAFLTTVVKPAITTAYGLNPATAAFNAMANFVQFTARSSAGLLGIWFGGQWSSLYGYDQVSTQLAHMGPAQGLARNWGLIRLGGRDRWNNACLTEMRCGSLSQPDNINACTAIKAQEMCDYFSRTCGDGEDIGNRRPESASCTQDSDCCGGYCYSSMFGWLFGYDGTCSTSDR